mgnify:CR=1 FL=1
MADETDVTVLDDNAVLAAADEVDRRNALEIIQAKLAEYGLEGLTDQVNAWLLEGFTAENVLIQIRDTEIFKERFRGMELRNAQPGMVAISPAEYIRLERQYRGIMEAAGLPQGFYDSPDDFAQFIGNDVSPEEMRQRVSMASSAVSNINPELKNQLRDMYGVGVENDGELIMYFLDPERAINVIEQRLRIESAGLSATAIQATGQGISKSVARQLVADQNVQQREISQRLAPQAGLTQATFSDTGTTTTELAAATFGLDPESVSNIRKLRQRRQSVSQRRAGGLVTGMGAVGLGSAENQLDT